MGISASEFAAWAHKHHANGWHPLPLGGDKGKTLLARRITGYSPHDAEPPDFERWPTQFTPINLGLRCPLGVVGIDVDGYDGKRGLVTLAEHVARLGELPATYVTTARFDGSGIRWFRVPGDWRGHDLKASDGSRGDVELIQRHHRYAAVPPSVHHTGHSYRLLGPSDTEILSGELPAPTELPELPGSWQDALATPAKAVGVLGNRREIGSWLAAQTADDYAHGLDQVLTRFDRLIASGDKNRHNAMVDVLTLALKESRAGGYLGDRVDDVLRKAWLEAIDGDLAHDDAEFDEMFSWAISQAESDDHDERWAIMCRTYGARHDGTINTGCLDAIHSMLAVHNSSRDTLNTEEPINDGLDLDIQREVARLRVREAARDQYEALRARERLMVNADRAVDGLTFLTTSVDSRPLWGRDSHVLWAPGEGLMICGPQGVGKSTVVQQLALARMGLAAPDLFGFPVAADERPVLYLAMDRPPQIRRSLARMLNLDDDAVTATLKRQLVTWTGPLPFDAAQAPDVFAEWVALHGNSPGMVIVDSLKDLATGLAKDDVGAGVNAAMQRVIAAGTEFVVLHHQRKATADNHKPDKLSDVYGNSWITAGLGSVLLLWGEAGAARVELSHLKQPQEKVGPLIVDHTHGAGQSAASDPTARLTEMAHVGGTTGITLVEAVRGVYGVGQDDDGWLSAKGKVRRRLDKLTVDGLLTYDKGSPGGSGGGGKPAKWTHTSPKRSAL